MRAGKAICTDATKTRVLFGGVAGAIGMNTVAGMMLRTWVDIALDNVAYNFARVRRFVGTQTRIIAAVKANAYGHGMRHVARVLESCGADYFGVATVAEALGLRQAGITRPVIILGALYCAEEARQAVTADAIMTAADEAGARLISRALRRGLTAAVQVKIDVGMGRLGIWHEHAIAALERIAALPHLTVSGIFTHFPCADSDAELTQRQLRDFLGVVAQARRRGLAVPLAHCANSSALCFPAAVELPAVRPGIILYGMQAPAVLSDVRPVMSFYSRIAQVKSVPAGRRVSYGGTYTTPAPTRVAVVCAGYADGYLRAASNRGQALVRGRRVPVIGRVCMDQLMLDVGAVPTARPGDRVTLIGGRGRERIRAEDLAAWAQTIPYEITCAISSRVQRRFVGRCNASVIRGNR